MGKLLQADIGDVVDEDEPLPATATAVDSDVVDEDAGAVDKLPAHARPNADGSVTLPLRFPVQQLVKKDGKTRTDRYDALTFHRLTGADQRAIANAGEDMMAVVAFARSTRIGQAVMLALFDKMDMADITSGGQVLNSFFKSGPTTGT